MIVKQLKFIKNNLQNMSIKCIPIANELKISGIPKTIVSTTLFLKFTNTCIVMVLILFRSFGHCEIFSRFLITINLLIPCCIRQESAAKKKFRDMKRSGDTEYK